MKRSTSVWLLPTILVFLLFGAHDTFSQTSERNLTEYKQGPSFNLQNYYLPQGNQEKAPLRQFFWQLWTTRTKGFFSVISYTREGAPTNCKFFVEPNSIGQWIVVSECKRTMCPYLSEKRCRTYLKTIFIDTYDVVKRVVYGDIISSSSGPRRQQRQIPDSDTRDPLKFVVILEGSTSRSRWEW